MTVPRLVHRPADQEVHRCARTDQGWDRGAQGRQIRTGGGKERGPRATRGGSQDRKTHSIQGKHRAGAKVLRPARAVHAWGDPTGWGRRRGTLAGVVVGWLRPTFAILTLLAYKDLTKGCAFSGQRPAFFWTAVYVDLCFG